MRGELSKEVNAESGIEGVEMAMNRREGLSSREDNEL